MKIVTWNCNGAFRKKFQKIDIFQADIYIIQECENPELSKGDYKNWATNYQWIGKNKHKGLGIFAKPDIIISRLDWQDNDLQLFLPVSINRQINLVGVWTKHANSPTFGYIGQMWKYLELHKNKLSSGNSVLCGDLNSNKIWDVWDRWWNHSDVVRELNSINMHSLYHLATGEEQGSESSPTFYHQKKPQKPYHIDYAFSSQGLFDPQNNMITVGDQKWMEFSDHLPVAFTLTLNNHPTPTNNIFTKNIGGLN